MSVKKCRKCGYEHNLESICVECGEKISSLNMVAVLITTCLVVGSLLFYINNQGMQIFNSTSRAVSPLDKWLTRGEYIVTATPNVSIREKPSIKSKGLGKIIKGYGVHVNGLYSNDQYTINGKNGYWLRVSHNSIEGYIFSAYIEKKKIDNRSNEGVENTLIEKQKFEGKAGKENTITKGDSSSKLQKISDELSGKWVGEYTCRQGASGLTLILSTSSAHINGTFNFFPLQRNNKAKSGSYSLTGRVFEDGRFILKPKSWIKRPQGYTMVGMSGVINSSFDTVKGTITHTSCFKFELKRE